MGGRWDATNVVDAPVAVITPIGVDHTEYLGTEIADIAAEKAGIIVKQKDDLVPVDTVAVIGRQVPEAMEVVLAETVRGRRRGRSRGLRIRGAGPPGGGRRPTARTAGPRRGVLRDLPAAARRTSGPQRRHRAGRRRGVLRRRGANGNSTSMPCGPVSPPPPAPGDWNGCAAPQRFSSMPPTTPPVRRRWRRRWPRSSTSDSVVGIVSVMAEKDVDGILAALEPAFDQIIVTNNGSPRALDVESLAMRAEERFGPERVIASATLPDAIETATALVEEAGHRRRRLLRQRHRHHRVGRHRGCGPHAVRAGSGMSDRRRQRPPRRIRGRASAA